RAASTTGSACAPSSCSTRASGSWTACARTCPSARSAPAKPPPTPSEADLFAYIAQIRLTRVGGGGGGAGLRAPVPVGVAEGAAAQRLLVEPLPELAELGRVDAVDVLRAGERAGAHLVGV